MKVKSIELLIKPASMRCNLKCDYCFYVDEAGLRAVADHGLMEPNVVSALIDRAYEAASEEVFFTFQGGEPTLCGLAFFEAFVEEANAKKPAKLKLHWSLQTNGTLLDEEWALFFKKHDFLVGVSLDGPKALHEAHRGRGSFDKALRGVRLLKEYGVSCNVLCVVTNENAVCAKVIYDFYGAEGLMVQQYIPCLAPLGSGKKPLDPKAFGQFLCDFYDLWMADLKEGQAPNIRYFENLGLILSGQEPETCTLCGHCRLQFVTEADGGVYPCDFYCLDEYFLGNVLDVSLLHMAQNETARAFIAPFAVDEACASCRYYMLCKGGCRREGKTYCESYKMLFQHIEQGESL